MWMKCINLPTFAVSVWVWNVFPLQFFRDSETLRSELKTMKCLLRNLFNSSMVNSFVSHAQFRSLVKNKFATPKLADQMFCAQKLTDNWMSLHRRFCIRSKRQAKLNTSTQLEEAHQSTHTLNNLHEWWGNIWIKRKGKELYAIIIFFFETHSFFAAGFQNWQVSLSLRLVVWCRFPLTHTFFARVYQRLPSGAGPVRTGRRTTKKKFH